MELVLQTFPGSSFSPETKNLLRSCLFMLGQVSQKVI